MNRPRTAAVLVAWLCLVLNSNALAADSATLERARSLLANNDCRGAVSLLEGALPGGPDERPALLQVLRQAYAAAAKQAETSGDSLAAEMYRDNLEILNHKPTAGSPTAPAAPDPDVARASAPPTEDPAPPDEPRQIPVRTASAPSPAQEPAELPPAEAIGKPSEALEKPAPVPVPDLSAPTAEQAPEVTVATADAAFVARQYAQAGQLYGVLEREKRLPASRREHWAYCRCAEVVRRINARPTAAQEWQSIDAEIRQIRALSPNNWYAEYLRNLASERTSGQRPRASQKVVVRGAAPEEQATPRTPSRPATPKPAPAPALAAPPAAPAPAGGDRAAPGLGNWQIKESANFRVFHADPALADRIIEVAEAARESQAKRWASAAARAPWSPRCDIYVYPTGKVLNRMTNQPEESPGFSTMGMNSGQIISRRVNVRADHPNLLVAILPHEITHVVLADMFPNQQIPRWADEGMAVLAEPVSEQRLRAADLTTPLTSGKLFKLEDLMVMDYPDGQFWGLYYAQSVSLTRFLVEQGTPSQFIQFVQASQRNGLEAELRRVYKIEGVADLHKRWLAYARTRSTDAAVAVKPASNDETANRE